jgi:hypothetical protein
VGGGAGDERGEPEEVSRWGGPWSGGAQKPRVAPTYASPKRRCVVAEIWRDRGVFVWLSSWGMQVSKVALRAPNPRAALEIMEEKNSYVNCIAIKGFFRNHSHAACFNLIRSVV